MKNIFAIILLCFFSNSLHSQFVDSIYVGDEKRYIYETPTNFFKEKIGIDIEGKGDSVLVVRNDEKGFDLVDENSLNNIWKFGSFNQIHPKDISKALSIGQENPSFSSNFTIGGTTAAMAFNGSTYNRIQYATAGFGLPTFSSISNGTKIQFALSPTGTSVGYSMGVGSSTLWMGMPEESSIQKIEFYGGITPLYQFWGDGKVNFQKYGNNDFTGTPARYLAVKSNGDIIEVDGGGTVAGTGTAAKLTKWSTGGADIEDSRIVDNGINVGIGTVITPANYLSLDQSVTTGPKISLYNGLGYGIGISGSDLDFYSALNHRFYTGSTSTTQGAEIASFLSTGQMVLNNYGSGTVTGTAAKYLAVEVDGDVIEVDAPTSTNLYNTDGTLTANRTITSTGQSLEYSALDGNDINVSTFSDNGNTFAITDTGTGALSNLSQKPEYLKLTSAPMQLVNNDDYQLLWTDVETNSTTKNGGIGSFHYTNSEEPFLALVSQSGSSFNSIRFGGGDSGGNAATVIDFYTASNNTTTTGTRRMRINSSGNLGLGLVDPTDKLEVDGVVKINDFIKMVPTSTVPTSPASGWIYFDDGTNRTGAGPRYYNGSSWVDL